MQASFGNAPPNQFRSPLPFPALKTKWQINGLAWNKHTPLWFPKLPAAAVPHVGNRPRTVVHGDSYLVRLHWHRLVVETMPHSPQFGILLVKVGGAYRFVRSRIPNRMQVTTSARARLRCQDGLRYDDEQSDHEDHKQPSQAKSIVVISGA